MAVPVSAPAAAPVPATTAVVTPHPGDLQQTFIDCTKDKPVQEPQFHNNKLPGAACMKIANGTADAGVFSVYYPPTGGYVKDIGPHSEGYDPSNVGSDDGWKPEAKKINAGTYTNNGQHMYYAAGYGYAQHQPNYCSQSPGSYLSCMSNGQPGYGSHLHAPMYQQAPSTVMHYYPSQHGQDGTRPGSRKVKFNDSTNKVKAGGGGIQNQQLGFHCPDSAELSTQWGGYYCLSNYYDYYSPQWHSPTGGFQQNGGDLSACYVPPLPDGCVRYQGYPKGHSAPGLVGKSMHGGSKASMGKSGSNVAGTNWRAKEPAKHQMKMEEQAKVLAVSCDASNEQGQKSGSLRSKVQQPVLETSPCSTALSENRTFVVNRNDYNKEDFQTFYKAAKFFIIKSYSEDDIHKSIKYGVWSSTPNGNKRLDEAFRKAQEKTESAPAPIFFFFSVNSSGQFCGLAEMVGSVEFNKNMDFWLEGKWNGCLPVKWHVIKDVPNYYFRHITLVNNENKPVTHSRDTQEVHYQQGLEMLRIFKQFPIRTSLLDDFAFYDGRQRVLQERKLRQQQQAVRQYKQMTFEKKKTCGPAIAAYENKENGKPGETEVREIEATEVECVEADVKIAGDDVCPPITPPITLASNDKDAVVKSKDESTPKSAIFASKPKSAGNDTLPRTVFNYKKALLEGKATNVVDPPPPGVK